MGDIDILTENEIIERAQHRDDTAMTYMMEKYKGLVRQKARSLFLVGGDNDDLIQEGMIGLYKAICDYKSDKDASFKTFADLCISRQLYSAIKNSNRKKNIPLNTYISLYAPVERDNNTAADGDFVVDHETDLFEKNPEEIVIGKENINNIYDGLRKKFSNFENEVFSLYIEGMTYTEIAVKLGKSPKSVDNALQRIKSKYMSVTSLVVKM